MFALLKQQCSNHKTGGRQRLTRLFRAKYTFNPLHFVMEFFFLKKAPVHACDHAHAVI